MARNKKPGFDIAGETAFTSAEIGEGESLGEFLPTQDGDIELPAPDPVEVVELTAPESDHKDIGLWKAIFWRGRPIWQHSRTKTTMHKFADVKRLRNFK